MTSGLPNPDTPLKKLAPTGGWLAEPVEYAVRAEHADHGFFERRPGSGIWSKGDDKGSHTYNVATCEGCGKPYMALRKAKGDQSRFCSRRCHHHPDDPHEDDRTMTTPKATSRVRLPGPKGKPALRDHSECQECHKQVGITPETSLLADHVAASSVRPPGVFQLCKGSGQLPAGRIVHDADTSRWA